jgi:hypothetical protein
MEQFHFNYRDIPRICRYGFSVRRIGAHLTGILLAYLIYEILVYLSLLIADGTKVKTFWQSYGLLPVLPFANDEFNLLTIGAMWLGIFSFAAIFFLTSTVASKITIEQLRGDVFFSVGDAKSFIKEKWKTVLGSFLVLLFIILLLLLVPVSIALLGNIPFVGEPILVFASLFTPLAFLLGLLIAFIIAVFICSLFLVPAIVATTGADVFETIFQLFSILWNQPWRLIGYGSLLFLLKLILVPIWALFCIVGFLIVVLPIHSLHPTDIEYSIGLANKWLGSSIQTIVGLFYQNETAIFDINISQVPITPVSTTICAIFMTLTLICIAGGIVAYLFSLASVGTTLIYSIIRKHVDGQNVLETIGTDASLEPPQFIGDE